MPPHVRDAFRVVAKGKNVSFAGRAKIPPHEKGIFSSNADSTPHKKGILPSNTDSTPHEKNIFQITPSDIPMKQWAVISFK